MQSIMKRLGATLIPLDVSQITEQLSGLLLAEESVLEAAFGEQAGTLPAIGPLKGVVLSRAKHCVGEWAQEAGGGSANPPSIRICCSKAAAS